ncbi:MAG: alpha-glucuronidase family glycosyl hydrolase [Opitutaceae bacterium]|nr:alpha-glucuronidase family glycosyl hydrolase [Opitutaceae bacterium]
MPRVRVLVMLFAALTLALVLRSEDGYELWLRYRLEANQARRAEYASFGCMVIAPARPVLNASREELVRALAAISGTGPRASTGVGSAIYIGLRNDAAPIAALVTREEIAQQGPEGFVIRAGEHAGHRVIVIAAASDAGVLHGTFRLIRELQLGRSVAALNLSESPPIGRRMANHWDNPVRTQHVTGASIERGYAGDSFFKWGELPDRIDPRLHDWARLLAAMRLNGVVVNNVNTAKRGLEGWRLITTDYLPKLVAVAAVLRPYGVRLFVSVNFFSPVLVDELPTADPADPAVQRWWRQKAAEIYAAIPDFGGFLVKADSEGEPGPLKYGRTHAEGANVIAAALAPHGGEVHWRAFVYDRANGDRVTQAYTTFAPLDGDFTANASLQIKNGPLDFQVREPVSTLFGAMSKTRQTLELQITQEYTGHDKHVCYLGPMWHEVLGFAPHQGRTVASAISAIAGVMNTGDARNWTGHLLAQANTYAFGELAWTPTRPPEDIAAEWAQLTFGRDRRVIDVVTAILLQSWHAYEDYTGPLGIGFLTRRGDHFTPDPENRAEYHGGDVHGVGVDRTVATGSGYAGQYGEPWRARYESRTQCPEELLLFFHHVPYSHRLKNGRSVLDEIYVRHVAGVESARGFVRDWETLRGRIDDERFEHVRIRLAEQVRHAEDWCRAVNGYFEKLSGVSPLLP